MFEILEKKSVTETSNIIYYAIRILNNDNIEFLIDKNNKPLVINTIYAQDIANEILYANSRSHRNLTDKYIIELYNILKRKIDLQNTKKSDSALLLQQMRNKFVYSHNEVTLKYRKKAKIQRICRAKKYISNSKNVKYIWVHDSH